MAYVHQAAATSPHAMNRPPVAPYRPPPHYGVPAQQPQHTMPLPQQSHIPPSYGDPYNPLATNRAPIPDNMLPGEGLVPLAAGVPPPSPEPPTRSLVENGRRYELMVVQQPRRARMCGFGDKDRRPITPPPCVRLMITDALSGKEIDVNEIEHGMYVLNVDLWSADGMREVNLVRHSATSPSISSSSPISYSAHEVGNSVYSNSMPGMTVAGPRDAPSPQYAGQAPSYPAPAYGNYPLPPPTAPYSQGTPPASHGYNGAYAGYQAPPPPGNHPYPPSQNGYSTPPGQYPPPPNAPQHQSSGSYGDYRQPGPDYPGQSPYGARGPPNDMSLSRAPATSAQPTGMFTRNLIGSLTSSAFRLTDPNDRIGIWFILQDLSVRTEGSFRLRFSFVNVGTTDGSTPTPVTQSSIVNTGSAPVLASCYSEPFTVYSAKKFPGVVESTPLSKCFATQGIKIPIRKDGPSKKDGREEYDDD